MFGFKRAVQKDKTDLEALKDELRKSRQEREAARLGLTSAVKRLVNELQSIPLDAQVEMVARDLAAAGRDDDAHS